MCSHFKTANLCVLIQMCLIVPINSENHPDITEHLAFVAVSVTIFLHIVAVSLECVDYVRKSDTLQ